MTTVQGSGISHLSCLTGQFSLLYFSSLSFCLSLKRSMMTLLYTGNLASSPSDSLTACSSATFSSDPLTNTGQVWLYVSRAVLPLSHSLRLDVFPPVYSVWRVRLVGAPPHRHSQTCTGEVSLAPLGSENVSTCKVGRLQQILIESPTLRDVVPVVGC